MLTCIHGVGTDEEIVNGIDVQLVLFILAKICFTENVVWEGAKSIFSSQNLDLI
jgi:hypothetical protein